MLSLHVLLAAHAALRTIGMSMQHITSKSPCSLHTCRYITLLPLQALAAEQTNIKTEHTNIKTEHTNIKTEHTNIKTREDAWTNVGWLCLQTV
jgi:hypothetical protein